MICQMIMKFWNDTELSRRVGSYVVRVLRPVLYVIKSYVNSLREQSQKYVY